jgi:hypothetical protein
MKIAAMVIWIVLAVLVMWAPANDALQHMRIDAQTRQRDRLAVSYANNVQFWTDYYNGSYRWIEREGRQK